MPSQCLKNQKIMNGIPIMGRIFKITRNWKSIFEQIQNASNEMQTKFNQVWEKASDESSPETMKLFGENWQKSMTDAGMKSFKDFGEIGKNHLMMQMLQFSNILLKIGKRV